MPNGKHIEQGRQVKDASLLKQETKAGPERNEELLLLKQLVEISQEQLRMLREREEREREGGAFGALFGAGDRVTAFSLAQFLPKEFLHHRGFLVKEDGRERGADYRKPSEFGEGIKGCERWLTAVFGGLWNYGLILDEGIRTVIKGEIVRDERLQRRGKEKLLSLTDGLFFIHNYNLSWLSCNGDTGIFTASTREGGVISPNERERLSLGHLKDQCRFFPGMARALSLTDAWAAKQRYDPKSPSKQEESPEDFCENKLSSTQLGMAGKPEWLIQYQKDLAMAWYRVLGFVDVRNYQEKHRQYTELMPSRESELETKTGRDKYEQAIIFRRWSSYDSPYVFLLDPLALFADVQKNYQDIIDNIRVGIREFQSEHNILNLGWRPTAWLLLEKIAGKPLKPAELEQISLATIGENKNKTLADATEDEWYKLLEDIEAFQKTNIKNAFKAGRAQEALAKSFSLDPKEFLNLYSSITSYLRSDNPEKDGIWTKRYILPMVTKGLTEILESMRKQGVRLPMTPHDLKRIIWAAKFLVAPTQPFSETQEKYITDSGQEPVVGVFQR